MPDFAFEECLLKHYIRKEVWLPFCRKRLQKIRASAPKNSRRIRYFTFCAVGALDVLLLDREKVLRLSSNDEFDTVFFFDKDREAIIETQKRIPGANGFPGDFVQVVAQADIGDDELDLEILKDERDTREVRQRQMRRAQLGDFIRSFPFDIINLDVEQYLYHPKEALPGVLTNAIRKIFGWQKRKGIGSNKKPFTLDEFTLMFTTQVGPAGLPKDYISYLRDDCITNNLEEFQELKAPFLKKSGGRNPSDFFTSDFGGAFKLAVPKSLTELALEQDWYIDDDKGIQVYQFERPFVGGTYCMLHMVMTVKRQQPPEEKRAPGQTVEAALGSHKNTIVKLFDVDAISVETLVVGAMEDALKQDLQKLFKHRERYYKPPAE